VQYGSKLKGLKQGDYFVNIIPKFISQFASKELVSDILNNSRLVIEDPKWEDFGFSTLEEYGFWANRLCGIVCIKMAMLGLDVNISKNIAALTKRAIELGGYITYDNDGKLIDKGWFYLPLVELVREYGLHGEVYNSFTEENLCNNVMDNVFSIVSVNPGIIRFDYEKCESKGGHLVLILGFKWNGKNCEGFFIHNPSGRKIETQEKAYIPMNIFNKSFAERGFSIRK